MHCGADHPRLSGVLALHYSERTQIVDHPRKYLKPAPAAEKIGVTPETLANWRWKQIGPPYYRVQGLILYRDDEIDAWVAAGRQSTAASDTISRPEARS
jgi:hypothetical protein